MAKVDITITVEVPVPYFPTGEFRTPLPGEYYITYHEDNFEESVGGGALCGVRVAGRDCYDPVFILNKVATA